MTRRHTADVRRQVLRNVVLGCAFTAGSAVGHVAGAAPPPVMAPWMDSARTLRAAKDSAPPPTSGEVVGSVTDSASTRPMQSVEIAVMHGTSVVSGALTDAFGRYYMHNIPNGTYSVSAHFIGYKAKARTVVVAGATVHVNFQLVEAPATLAAVEVTAQEPVAVDTRTGDQTYNENAAVAVPTATTSAILQQSIAGAARAPTGEVHIRGQHAEYTYYIDGVPVPPGISGSLNELFDPSVVDNIDFQTGGWDAQYGGRMSAIINITTKIPTGAFHAEESTFGGSYNTLGQSASLSANSGRFGYYLAGSAQSTGMRQDPVLAGPGNAPLNYSNSGQDYYVFGKVQYAPSDVDIMSLDANWSKTHFDVPYDSTTTFLDDHQTDQNAFINYGYRHRFGLAVGTDEESQPAELALAAYWRNGSLHYVPGATDVPSFIDASDPTMTPRNVSEDRFFNILGMVANFGFPIVSGLIDGKIGGNYSNTFGHENFQLTDPTGVQPPIASLSGLEGYDWGVYAQTAIRPVVWFETRLGVRFDSHVEPFASNQTQVSPRVRFNFFPDASNTVYLYFGRLFMPTNIEDLRSITQAGDSNVATTATLPERDAFYEVGYIHRFPFGVITKLSAYHKESTPGIDDNTVPGSAITTDVNIDHVWVTGIEGVIEVRPTSGPLSGYINAALNHAYGIGPVTGGFFPEQTPPTYFDLDHDQRFSGVWNILYSAHGFFVSATGIYGTGLTNGFTPDTNAYNIGTPGSPGFQPGNKSYCTALFCFNRAYKVPPSYVQNLSLGYAIPAGKTTVTPEVYFTNLFDSQYLLKGAFFSGESVGRPFTVQFRLSVGI